MNRECTYTQKNALFYHYSELQVANDIFLLNMSFSRNRMMDLTFRTVDPLQFHVRKVLWENEKTQAVKQRSHRKEASSPKAQQTHIKMSWLNLSPVSHGLIFRELRSTTDFLIAALEVLSCFSIGHSGWNDKFCFAMTKSSWTSFSQFSQNGLKWIQTETMSKLWCKIYIQEYNIYLEYLQG